MNSLYGTKEGNDCQVIISVTYSFVDEDFSEMLDSSGNPTSNKSNYKLMMIKQSSTKNHLHDYLIEPSFLSHDL